MTFKVRELLSEEVDTEDEVEEELEEDDVELAAGEEVEAGVKAERVGGEDAELLEEWEKLER